MQDPGTLAVDPGSKGTPGQIPGSKAEASGGGLLRRRFFWKWRVYVPVKAWPTASRILCPTCLFSSQRFIGGGSCRQWMAGSLTSVTKRLRRLNCSPARGGPLLVVDPDLGDSFDELAIYSKPMVLKRILSCGRSCSRVINKSLTLRSTRHFFRLSASTVRERS